MGGRGSSGTRSGGGASAATGKDPEEMTIKEADEAFKEHLKKMLARKDRGRDMQKALSDYQETSSYVNDMLRDPNKLIEGFKLSLKERQKIQKQIAAIQKAIKLSPGLPRAVTLIRGVGDNIGSKLAGMKKGTVFQDSAFTSTSFNTKVHKKTSFHGDYILRIQAPKGTKGAAMHKGWARKTGNEGEGEYLLGSGTKFKVTGSKKRKDGRTIIKVKIVK